MPGFPRLGAQEHHAKSASSANGVKLRSQFFPDELISTNERYGTIHDNLRARRKGRAFKVKVPIYRDTETPWPWKESKHLHSPNGVQEQDARRGEDQAENFIYGDSMSYGPSCCGLQITMQARNLREARYLHDQLCPIGPILMALSAATPFFRGFLTDTDLRWNQSALAVDDRTSQELKASSSAPRWSHSAMYISDDPRCHSKYNKPVCKGGQRIEQQLQRGGMDALLASHYATILARDPIALTKKELQDHEDVDLFEILQSAVWPHVDFKVPSSDGKAGWRVEFRPLEVQPTDFENASFAIFVALLARTILHFDLNLYIPIEKVEENMQRAHTRNAVMSERFFFRRKIHPTQEEKRNLDDEYTMMTIDGVINGSESSSSEAIQSFPGLIPLVQSYVEDEYAAEPQEKRRQLLKHLDLIRKRATGELPTPASWMRRFVQEHEEYKQDSIVSERICFDLMQRIRDLGAAHAFSDELGT
ncbi:hypothetical protein H2200_008621 [Cladophialophora chaetospira]|uniref:Glutamate--cysteine ligase n=1 Tax=Cladophialophora chaetospira TaxID=386627 RepID=A0AA38X4N0_9EURO|nr:hypothetical protein H2200_008621 [Cladophialophora chaetospira]